MSLLPRVPLTGSTAEQRDYLVQLVRSLEGQLRQRPVTQEGALYVADNMVLRLVSPNGTVYELTVDDAGSLVTTEVDP